MVGKDTKLQTTAGAISAKDLARLATQHGSAQDIAKQLSAVVVPTDALKNLATSLSQPNTAIDAKHLAPFSKHLSAITTLTDAAKHLAVLHANLPKVTLHLPDLSQRVQASLPRPLFDTSLPGQQQINADVTGGGTNQSEAQAAAGPDGVEITSPEALGRLIRGARERRNLSQQSFADLAGVGRRFVSELENGKATLELGKVLKVARAAGISILARNR